jgi:chromosome segregation ATPase
LLKLKEKMLVQKERIDLLTSTNKKIYDEKIKIENLLSEQNAEIIDLKFNLNNILNDKEMLSNEIIELENTIKSLKNKITIKNKTLND